MNVVKALSNLSISKLWFPPTVHSIGNNYHPPKLQVNKRVAKLYMKYNILFVFPLPRIILQKPHPSNLLYFTQHKKINVQVATTSIHYWRKRHQQFTEKKQTWEEHILVNRSSMNKGMTLTKVHERISSMLEIVLYGEDKQPDTCWMDKDVM